MTSRANQSWPSDHYAAEIDADAIQPSSLPSAEREMLKALEYAAELIKVARRYFPKSIHNSDRFELENTCAAISKALHNAKAVR